MNPFFYLYTQCDHRAVYLKYLTVVYEINVHSIVEVGVWKGGNARLLRHLFPDAHLYLIDPWRPYETSSGAYSSKLKDFESAYQETKGHFENDPQTTLMRTTSLEAAQELPNNLDLVFIDGSHEYSAVKSDIEIWQTKVRQGGILSGHDYSTFHPEVMQAVKDTLKNKFFVGKDDVWVHHNP